MARGTRFQQVVYGVATAAVVAIVAASGCGKAAPKGLSYADALQIYNDETRALDRLKEQRAELQAQLDNPPGTGSIEAAEQILGNTTDLSQQLSGALKDLGGPGSPLASDEIQMQQEKLIGSVTGQIEQVKAQQKEKAAKWQETSKEIEAKIGELDTQIAAQQTRVERALADKEAAEAAR